VILGQWRDRFPRVTLTLPSANGPLAVEFVVDTGFDGELAMPETLVHRLDARILESRSVELAGGFMERCFAYELVLEWDGEERFVELLTLKRQAPYRQRSLEGLLFTSREHQQRRGPFRAALGSVFINIKE
jgi:predicted aspartyl protease